MEFLLRRTPSPALVPRAPSPHGRGQESRIRQQPSPRGRGGTRRGGRVRGFSFTVVGRGLMHSTFKNVSRILFTLGWHGRLGKSRLRLLLGSARRVVRAVENRG